MAGDERRTVAELFERIAAGDPDGALELVHPEVRWLPTVWSSGGALIGRRGVREWLAQFGPSLEHLRIDIEEIIGETGWIVVLGIVHDARGGDDFSVMVGWTFAVADGMVSEGRAFATWEEARAAGGAG